MTTGDEAPDDGETGTKRFRAKREAILAAAAEAINEQSAKGMTFADVARRVGLNTTSVTYYFKRKEDLAAAAFEHTLDHLLALLDKAAEAATPRDRIARYLALNMARLDRVERREERNFAVLSDLRAMEEPVRARLMSGWREVFRRTRALWGPARFAQAHRPALRACTRPSREHLLASRLARPLRARPISAGRGAADGRLCQRDRDR